MMLGNEELKNAGLKVTLPRLKILKLFEQTKQRHLSADEIYKLLLEQGEDVGLATVYRVLTQFETAGILDRQNFENSHSVFELVQEDHHDHIVCERCGTVIEFHNSVIEQQQREVATQLGFTLTGHSLNLYGVCNNGKCRSE